MEAQKNVEVKNETKRVGGVVDAAKQHRRAQ